MVLLGRAGRGSVRLPATSAFCPFSWWVFLWYLVFFRIFDEVMGCFCDSPPQSPTFPEAGHTSLYDEDKVRLSPLGECFASSDTELVLYTLSLSNIYLFKFFIYLAAVGLSCGTLA